MSQVTAPGRSKPDLTFLEGRSAYSSSGEPS